MECAQPSNKNFLSPIGFQFAIQRIPHVTYFCTVATVPEMTMGQIDQLETPFIRMPQPGDKLRFGELSLRFRIDEDMKNFREIYDWMIGLGYPDNFDQRIPIQRASLQTSDQTVFSDASLIVLTNQYKPNIEVKFIDLYPTSLSSVEFNVEQTDVEYLNADVSFVYRKYELNTII